jgi:hypothetical protein
MKLNLRTALILAALALAGGIAACSDTSKPAIEPTGPSLDCGGYLGGGGGRVDSTGVCIESAPTDSI